MEVREQFPDERQRYIIIIYFKKNFKKKELILILIFSNLIAF
jgi:hypothetical protein